eukprot:410089-Rhodomonas_salina.1
MAESARRHCRWQAPAGRFRRPPGRPEFRWRRPSRPNPCSPAVCRLRCAVARRARTPAAVAPGHARAAHVTQRTVAAADAGGSSAPASPDRPSARQEGAEGARARVPSRSPVLR